VRACGRFMRSPLQPASWVGAEIGDSWRHMETVGVPGAWALLGLIVAPIVLGRMARAGSPARAWPRAAPERSSAPDEQIWRTSVTRRRSRVSLEAVVRRTGMVLFAWRM